MLAPRNKKCEVPQIGIQAQVQWIVAIWNDNAPQRMLQIYFNEAVKGLLNDESSLRASSRPQRLLCPVEYERAAELKLYRAGKIFI